jgi:hypothetical protein
MLANGSRGAVTGFLAASACRKALRSKILEARARPHALRSALHVRWCAELVLRLQLEVDEKHGTYIEEDEPELGSGWVFKSELERNLQNLQESEHSWVPVVRFLNGVERAIFPESFEQVVYNLGTCYRVMTPLKLAWALTARAAPGAPASALALTHWHRRIAARRSTSARA